MRKNSIAIISLAFLASCFMVSCSTEAFDTNQPVKGAKIVIPAQKMSTKAVDAEGEATFLKSENVYIAKSGTIDANAIHPSAKSASTTFTGTLAGSYATGNHITVLYNTNASGVVDYSGQDGAIESVKDAGWAEDVEIVSLEGDVLTTESAKLENLQSIFKFTFYNGSTSAEISGVRFVRIYSNSNKLVATYDVLTPDNSTYGPITVSRNSDLADNFVYAALRFDANPSDVIRFEVVDNANNVYLGTKTAPAAGFKNGIFYNSSVTVTLTPASKMAFRGYEVSAGILKRTKSGDDDAAYSLTSGEMTRISGTMNYTLPDGCNPFEPAINQNSAALDKYYHKWLTLRSELGASGNDINALSGLLPAGWRFPTGGNKTNSDWGKIMFGVPKSTITVNETIVSDNAYAFVTVSLESGDTYSVPAGTYKGVLLLRDGTTIPTGLLSKVGSGTDYGDNILDDTTFKKLVQYGCLFIPVTGYFTEVFNSFKNKSDAIYWSNTHNTGSKHYYLYCQVASGWSVSVTSSSSDNDKEYKIVKLVKPVTD